MRWPKQHYTDAADEHILLTVLRGDNWSCGEMAGEFERRFAAFCGCKHAILVVNCTSAIRLALRALGIGPGDEVVVPGLTWPSVAIAVLDCGAEPVPADVNRSTYCVSADTINARVTERTRAIIVAHLFCSQVEMPSILELAAKKRIPVIEDAAHSVGARRAGKASGALGTVGCFSFNQKKLLSCGEGGCLVTDDDDVYTRVRDLREVNPNAASVPVGLPETSLISEFQAAILTTQLERLPERLRRMDKNAEMLRVLLSRHEGVSVLDRLPGTDVQTFYAFCFRVADVQDISAFRRRLGEALGLSVSGAYVPLNVASVLNASGDPRYKYLGTRLAAPLPECERAHYREAVRLRHNVLLAEPETLKLIADSVGHLLTDVRRSKQF